jgi:hypothetical protein
MVHLIGLNFKDARNEENFGLRMAQGREQQLCFLLSPEGHSMLRNKRKILTRR